MVYTSELYHHGVLGQKWGVRRYQYKDGTRTPAGKKHEATLGYRKDLENQNGGSGRSGSSSGTGKFQTAEAKAKYVSSMMSEKVKDVVNTGRTVVTGRQYVDGYLKEGTTFARIQTSENFENFAFYATYKKADQEKYMGLFGKNLATRAAGDAKRAEKQANASGSEEDIKIAKEKRAYSDNLKVYQVKLETTKKLRIPSDENAADITKNLLKEKDFKDNVIASIEDSKSKMLRPTQQLLFKQAQNALNKDPDKMTSSEKVAVYKALNLSLTNHNAQEIAAQDRFYGELKKKGYSALLDYNDKDYSSYHAKRPMIVFDTDAVKLQSVTETNPKLVDQYYSKYNKERIAKETVANTVGLIDKFATKTVSECSSYVKGKMDDYMK